MLLSVTWTQVDHPRRSLSYFVRDGLQRGPQAVVGAQHGGRRDGYQSRDHRERRENAVDGRQRHVPVHYCHRRRELQRNRRTGMPACFCSAKTAAQDCVRSENERAHDVTGGGCQAMGGRRTKRD